LDGSFFDFFFDGRCVFDFFFDGIFFDFSFDGDGGIAPLYSLAVAIFSLYTELPLSDLCFTFSASSRRQSTCRFVVNLEEVVVVSFLLLFFFFSCSFSFCSDWEESFDWLIMTGRV